MVYALVGCGLNIILGVMNVINMSHGEFIMLFAFTNFFLYFFLNINPLASLFFLIPISFLAGVLTYYLTIPRLLKSENPQLNSYIVYYGLSLIISSAALFIFGESTRGIPFPFGVTSLKLLGFTIPVGRLVAAIISLIANLMLMIFLYRTYMGKATRATIQSRDSSMLLGIDVGKISVISFGIGILATGIAGGLIPIMYPAINPYMGFGYTLIAWACIVLGGLGNPVGGIIGGLIYGIAETLAGILLPTSFSPLIAFLIIIVVVALKPEGLLGEKKRRMQLRV